MSIAEKFEVIADEVYDKGQAKKESDMWDIIQNYGDRVDYAQGFFTWNCDYIRPKHKVTSTINRSGYQTFRRAKIKKIETKYFDFSQKTRGTYAEGGWYYTFTECSELEDIEDIGMQADYTYIYTYAWCRKLKTIAVIRTDEDTRWSHAFDSCSALENLPIEGTIGQSGFNVKDCKKLSGESIVSIIEALSTTTSGLTVTLSQTAVDNMVFPIVSKKGTYNSWIDLAGDGIEDSPNVGIRPNWKISLV